MKIAQRCNAGKAWYTSNTVPEGRLKACRFFSRAYGTGSNVAAYPPLKRRATIKGPSGTIRSAVAEED